jgi:hypothetical protein
VSESGARKTSVLILFSVWKRTRPKLPTGSSLRFSACLTTPRISLAKTAATCSRSETRSGLGSWRSRKPALSQSGRLVCVHWAQPALSVGDEPKRGQASPRAGVRR